MEQTGNKHREPREELSREEVRAIISEIKQDMEEEFQERLKTMTPKEREAAIAFADALL